MEDEADAIVGGSGINGLVAATDLTRAGWSVILLERNAEVGEEWTLRGYLHVLLLAQFRPTDRDHADQTQDVAKLKAVKARPRSFKILTRLVSISTIFDCRITTNRQSSINQTNSHQDKIGEDDHVRHHWYHRESRRCAGS